MEEPFYYGNAWYDPMGFNKSGFTCTANSINDLWEHWDKEGKTGLSHIALCILNDASGDLEFAKTHRDEFIEAILKHWITQEFWRIPRKVVEQWVEMKR